MLLSTYRILTMLVINRYVFICRKLFYFAFALSSSSFNVVTMNFIREFGYWQSEKENKVKISISVAFEFHMHATISVNNHNKHVSCSFLLSFVDPVRCFFLFDSNGFIMHSPSLISLRIRFALLSVCLAYQVELVSFRFRFLLACVIPLILCYI
jgi:hypothetical protein